MAFRAQDFDRRNVNREPNPRCPQCKTVDGVRVTVRTSFAVYFRCVPCGEVWSRQHHVLNERRSNDQPRKTDEGSNPDE